MHPALLATLAAVDPEIAELIAAEERRQRDKIRLAGIDAPEKKQAFGNVSRLSLEQLVAGKAVRVETDKTDRYGRAVGVVSIAGVDVSQVQIERGMAA